MAQDDLNMAELSQVTPPSDVTITLVLRIPATKQCLGEKATRKIDADPQRYAKIGWLRNAATRNIHETSSLRHEISSKLEIFRKSVNLFREVSWYLSNVAIFSTTKYKRGRKKFGGPGKSGVELLPDLSKKGRKVA
jgi:hypothetical protein